LNAIKRQGTTSVVPKEEQKVTWALAPAIFFQLFMIPQRLKPESYLARFGTTEVVP
jgi:hypothetical protein